MPLSPPINARDYTASVGTGPFVLLSIRAGNHSLPSEVLTDGASISGVIASDKQWVSGTFSYAASTHTLTATAISDSSNGGAPVQFAAGRKLVALQAASVPDWAEVAGGGHPAWSELKGDAPAPVAWSDIRNNPLLHAPIPVSGTTASTDTATSALIAALIALGIPLIDSTTPAA